MCDIFMSNLFNFGLIFSKEILSFNKYDLNTRPVIGWISIKHADNDVSCSVRPQSSQGRFPSVQHYYKSKFCYRILKQNYLKMSRFSGILSEKYTPGKNINEALDYDNDEIN